MIEPSSARFIFNPVDREGGSVSEKGRSMGIMDRAVDPHPFPSRFKCVLGACLPTRPYRLLLLTLRHNQDRLRVSPRDERGRLRVRLRSKLDPHLALGEEPHRHVVHELAVHRIHQPVDGELLPEAPVLAATLVRVLLFGRHQLRVLQSGLAHRGHQPGLIGLRVELGRDGRGVVALRDDTRHAQEDQHRHGDDDPAQQEDALEIVDDGGRPPHAREGQSQHRNGGDGGAQHADEAGHEYSARVIVRHAWSPGRPGGSGDLLDIPFRTAEIANELSAAPAGDLEPRLPSEAQARVQGEVVGWQARVGFDPPASGQQEAQRVQDARLGLDGRRVNQLFVVDGGHLVGGHGPGAPSGEALEGWEGWARVK
ncbi:hypothetical protein BO70DRAFT_172222 [Aspergillus heteromorphus CBS 117.55]|uniref:Uncharacterized protein n=1 Tax=Aspergillus heteromorphus CBS 117.55 TaxID=1448321 RepID=A0A317V083_9EURO|nr:uncharacterized protein BO70DRAFT_172222 [Aspergillus heteromorphus CBS 117.55]PWY66781.1 hypothetical protein BO70DRAFT_172222 [Aspergillus heteromorphus CBS 117.55]